MARRMLHLFIPGGIDRYFVEWQEYIASNDAPGVITSLAARYDVSYATDQR